MTSCRQFQLQLRKCFLWWCLNYLKFTTDTMQMESSGLGRGQAERLWDQLGILWAVGTPALPQRVRDTRLQVSIRIHLYSLAACSSSSNWFFMRPSSVLSALVYEQELGWQLASPGDPPFSALYSVGVIGMWETTAEFLHGLWGLYLCLGSKCSYLNPAP